MIPQPSYAIILAGGQGSRLRPLTNERAKPAVPFGGMYRIIDFVLNNLKNSRYEKIAIASQFMPDSLHDHLDNFWRYQNWDLRTYPAMQDPTRDALRFTGTADAVYHTLQRISRKHNLRFDITDMQDHGFAENTLIFGGDHIYAMDVMQKELFHSEKGADLSISAIPVRIEEAAGQFGVIVVDKTGRVQAFEEKPLNPTEMPGRPGYCLASMGNYIFRTQPLLEALVKDNADPASTSDFGKDVIPQMLKEGKAIFAYDFSTNIVPGTTEDERGYWQDVGTLHAFYDANMALLQKRPPLNIFNRKWPLVTLNQYSQPARHHDSNISMDALICNGAQIIASQVRTSIVSPGVTLEEGCNVEESYIMGGETIIGRGSRINRAVIDKHVVLPPCTEIGYDETLDKERGFTVEDGITFVPRGYTMK